MKTFNASARVGECWVNVVVVPGAKAGEVDYDVEIGTSRAQMRCGVSELDDLIRMLEMARDLHARLA